MLGASWLKYQIANSMHIKLPSYVAGYSMLRVDYLKVFEPIYVRTLLNESSCSRVLISTPISWNFFFKLMTFKATLFNFE